jgi:protein-S-isoprenylcysteine O-methyltransferase Ste14
MVRLIIFAVVSVFLFCVSIPSLRVRRSHGFYRFFAWESIVAIILLNVDRWFFNPFSAQQVISWLLLVVSIYLAVQGFYLLRTAGRPDEKREDATLAGFEKTTSLVTVGAYKYIRHPMYSSLLCIALGAFLKNPSWPAVVPTLGAAIFLALTAKAEEKECARFFGPAYEAYTRQTKMFIPFLF